MGVFLVAGCDSGDAKDQPVILDRSAAEQEYRRTAETLTLPAGATFPGALPKAEAELMYEPGYATSIAENFWICAWGKEWLARRENDRPAAQAALDRLGEAPRTAFLSKHLDAAGRRLFAGHLAKARAGDPIGFRQYVDANCTA
ncbi:hypothetical protein [Symbioplanes lichenis]|uniref:hypothetical protein n=1 Tax=Symbioplanes lichenis TaxID=1629072 RepID=UPI002738282C|nr:hypothetical protein [Actinoplanes lichenis]